MKCFPVAKGLRSNKLYKCIVTQVSVILSNVKACPERSEGTLSE
jgi:hypothetical protein